MAAALGLGLEPGDVAMSIGTSGTVFVVSDLPTADPSGAVAGFADANGRFLPLVCTSNATKVTDAVARLLGRTATEVDELALTADPGAGGLVLLPYLDGERTPARPAATGVLAGIRSDVDAAQLARAAHEGVVCSLLDGLDALRAHTRTDDGRLWLVGGGARSFAYRQILADLSGRPVLSTVDTEMAAAGACVQAAAVASGRDPCDVAQDWRLAGSMGSCNTTEPAIDSDTADEIRVRYAARRDREG
jgi:xylulokinase